MSSSVLYVCLYSVSLDCALQVMAVLVLILATKFSISKLVVCVWCLIYSKVEKFLVQNGTAFSGTALSIDVEM